MTDTTATAADTQPLEHCVSTEGGHEYLFSRCSSCGSLHKRQEVLRISAADLQKWKDAGRYANQWYAFLASWPLWVFIFFMLSVDGNFYPKFGWPVTVVIWSIGVVFCIIGYRLNRKHSESKSTIRNGILEKYEIHVLWEKVDTLENLKDSDWESEQDDDSNIKYALAVEK